MLIVSLGRDGQIPMAVLHSRFSFRLNTLHKRYILLHSSIANKCKFVVSEEHEMASFIRTEQCVNVAYFLLLLLLLLFLLPKSILVSNNFYFLVYFRSDWLTVWQKL